jgi:hypothetical protein
LWINLSILNLQKNLVYLFKMITIGFLDDVNEKLHCIIQVFIHQINCTTAYIYRNSYHSERKDLQLDIYLHLHLHDVVFK